MCRSEGTPYDGSHAEPGGLLLTRPGADRLALTELPSTSDTIPHGIVIDGSVPPNVKGSLATLLTTIAAAMDVDEWHIPYTHQFGIIVHWEYVWVRDLT